MEIDITPAGLQLLRSILVWIVIACVLYSLFKFTWRFEITNKKEVELPPPPVKPLTAAEKKGLIAQEERDLRRLANWKKRNPYGPINHLGRQELRQLVKDRMISYANACYARGTEIDQTQLESIKSEITDDRDY